MDKLQFLIFNGNKVVFKCMYATHLHYLVKYLCSENRHAQAVKEANRHVKLSHSKTGVK